MQFDLKSATDAGLHILYDPASVMHRISQPYDNWHKDILDDVAPANVIAYNNGGDGEAKFRVFVDEIPDEEIARRALAKRTGHLKVPTGRLFASGMELLDSRGNAPATPQEFQLRSTYMGSSHEIPAGHYDVEAYDLDPESEKVEAALQRAVEAARSSNSLGFRLAVVHRVLALGGLLHFVTIVAVAILLIFFAGDRAAGWMLLESKWGLIYRVLAAIWGIRIVLGLLPPVRAFYGAINVEAERHPLTVVVLTRRASEPDMWQGVAFGEMDLPSSARPRYTVP